jgi:hypothetical protein
MVWLRIQVSWDEMLGEWFQMIGQNVMNYTSGTVSHRRNFIPKIELLVEFETTTPHREHSPATLWKSNSNVVWRNNRCLLWHSYETKTLWAEWLFFFFAFKLGGVCSIKWILIANYIIYIYVYCIKTTWTMYFNYLDRICEFGGSAFFQNVGIRLLHEVSWYFRRT